MRALSSGRVISLLSVFAVASALTGCAESSGDAGGGGEDGVAAGSSKQAYQEALAEIDPIELVMQTPAPKGSASGANLEGYAAAVEDWSGGKITFEIAYANALAGPTEADEALADGRLDIAGIVPALDPSEFPAISALAGATIISDHSPVLGALQSNAWPNAVAIDSPDILQEAEERGMKLLLPWFDSGSDGIFCRKVGAGLDTFDGAVIRTPGAAQAEQAEALGGSSVSMSYAELFEAVQRGVIDCAVASMTVGVLSGMIPEAPHAVFDPDAGFAVGMGSLAFSQARWESLPLVVQQLLWDRIDVFVESNITQKIWPNVNDATTQILEAGGSVVPFDDDARAALQEANEKLLSDLQDSSALSDPEQLLADGQDAAAEWLQEIEGLGYEPVSYADFPEWYAGGAADLADYVALFAERILAPGRPE